MNNSSFLDRRCTTNIRQIEEGVMNDMTDLPQPARNALEQFSEEFQDKEVASSGKLGAAWAPGRVNLIGEHTDYNDGYVLPLAVDRVVAFAGRARSDTMVRLWSNHFQEPAQFDLAGLPSSFEVQKQRVPAWTRYVLGVLSELCRAGAWL